MRFVQCQLLVLLLLIGETGWAQISINYPLNRCVFQRDKNNNATVYVAGHFSEAVDKIEVQFKPLNGGHQSDWLTVQERPSGGYYRGSVTWSAGWYELEVRGKRGDQVVGHSTLSRIGIGEVFLVAGQSNAQGYLNFGAPGSGDDRVNGINYYNINDPNDRLPYPEFSAITENSFISPRGNSAWCWGRLGAILAQRLNVPVLFYNVGWYSSAAKNWRESINGMTYSVHSGEPFLPYGMPYGNIRLAIQNYVAMTGVRAVLWLQGEAEGVFNNNADQYFNDLSAVINQTRNESGKNLSWVISRTSYGNLTGVYQPAIDGQNRVLNEVHNTFRGPNTDEIQMPRPDGLHFSGQGLSDLAEGWGQYLNDDFFSRSEPYQALPIPNVNVSCAGNNQVSLSVEGSYPSLQWNNGQGASTIQVGSGIYKATIRDPLGNVIYSPEIRITGVIQPDQPTINLPGGDKICQGGALLLQSSSHQNPIWSTGQSGDQILVSNAGQYAVKVTSIYGCESVSNPVNIGVHATPPPPRPSITVAGVTTFCDGGEVTLRSSSGGRSEWSEQSRTGDLLVKKSGIYTVRAFDDNGCYSPASDAVSVTVHSLPAKPIIRASAATVFCDGGSIVLTSSYDQGNLWSNSVTTSNITVSQSGTFSVKVKDGNGCENTSDQTTVKVNPLPISPVISNLRPTTFCENDHTVLQSDPQASYRWSNGNTGREADISVAGEYYLTTTDQNGCTSKPSSSVRVIVNPLPPRPVVTAKGPTTFCADQQVVLESTVSTAYQWSNGQQERSITLTTAGSYSLVTRNEFGCSSPTSNSVNTEVLPLPSIPRIKVDGDTRFCDGESVALTAEGSAPFCWSTGDEAFSILAKTSGDYFVQTVGANGCLSLKGPAVAVEVKAVPRKPEVKKVGVFTLLAETSLANTFQWEEDSRVLIGQQATIKVTQSGEYRVRALQVYDAELTCASEYSELFRFSVADNRDKMVFYPNPVSGDAIYIEIQKDLGFATIQFYDGNGRLVKTLESVSFAKRVRLDTTFLPNGVYLVKVFRGDESYEAKLIIAK